MKGALAAVLVVVIAVAIVVPAVPRSDLPPAVQAATDHFDAAFDEARPTVQRLLRRAERVFDDVLNRVGSATANASRGAVSGKARVVDGDTLEIGGVRIRLHGVDAPESRQTCIAAGRRWPCGERATRALAGRIAGRTVACEERDRDRYGRIVAVCRHGGQDVNAWMVSQGLALAYRRYSRDYVAEEASARDARLGMWRGDFVPPWDWRRGDRLAGSRSAPKSAAGSGCRIKGNIGRNGDRIYHVPEGQFYERTRIDPSRGERWFCTEAEARGGGVEEIAAMTKQGGPQH